MESQEDLAIVKVSVVWCVKSVGVGRETGIGIRENGEINGETHNKRAWGERGEEGSGGRKVEKGSLSTVNTHSHKFTSRTLSYCV